MGLIYKITNKLNGKSYIGKTVQEFERRCRPQAYKSCVALSAAFTKYGWENFDKSIIEDNVDENQLASREEYWIKFYKTMVPNGYNIIELYEGLNRYTDETKQKISNSRYEYLKKLEDSGQKLIAVNKKEHIYIDNIEHKTCTKCDKTKLLLHFPKNNRKWDGLHAYCKPCHSENVNKFRKPTKKLSKEQLVQSYINRKDAVSLGVRKAYQENPDMKLKHSKAKNKAIMGISIADSSIIKFDSAKLAKEQGFDNTNIGKSIKTGIPYKGYRWVFQ